MSLFPLDPESYNRIVNSIEFETRILHPLDMGLGILSDCLDYHFNLKN